VELLEAIQSRRSIRSFNPDPVSKEVLFEMLGVAIRAPSSVNCQPWEIYVARGEILKKLRQAYTEQFRRGVKPRPEIYGDMKTRGLAPPLDGVYKERQVQLGKQIFHTLGIKKGDDQGLQDYYEKMYRFYDAPCIVVIAADQSLLISYVSLDVGLLTQTIALAAQAFGLGTCIMRAIVDYPETVKTIVGIPQSKRAIIGLAMGYPNWDDPINRLRTERESLDKTVTVRE